MTRSSHAVGLAFIAQAAASTTDECILWPFTCLPPGYGIIGLDRRKRKVTHLVLEASGRPRPDPPSDLALHSCPGGDNPACCNPRHLRWGSKGDNLRDAMARGQFAPRHRRGADHPGAALTADQVAAIRLAYDLGEGGYVTLARRFGVSRATVQRVVRRLSYVGHTT